MSQTKPTAVNSRINIPITPDTRSEMEEIASRKGVSLAELGRQALEAFLAEERRSARLRELCETATKHSDIINGVSEEWGAVETDGWSDE